MVCSKCGMNNQEGFKFCVKCGSSLETPSEMNYEQVDMGNYHSEDEFADNNAGFTMDTGTFVIKDKSPQTTNNNLYSAEELNQDEEEFDFSIYDEPALPSLEQPEPVQPPPVQQPPPQQRSYSQPPQQNVYAQQNSNPYMSSQQSVMYGQPQIIGYDPNGMPIYSQQQGMMYAQPQIIGYDLNGMPIYSQPQPMVFGQPQGMMYGKPQIMGYDPSGMPIYAQPNGMMNQGMMPNTANIPPYGQSENNKNIQMAEAVEKKETEKSEAKDFWSFFNDGNDVPHVEPDDNDFFDKAVNEPQFQGGDAFADIDNRRKQRLRKQQEANGVMEESPVADASGLAPNDVNRINKMFMRQMGESRSNDLAVEYENHKNRSMESTEQVDADKLAKHMDVRSRISMQIAAEADPDTLEQYVPEHKGAIMGQAEQLNQPKPKYEDELDKIELPDYMQARKTDKNEKKEMPSLPDF